MYKYILWDIDGTVLDFYASEAFAIRKLFKKYKLGDCNDEMLALYSGINAKYWRMLERNELTKAEILVERFREFFGIIGVDTSICESFNRDYQVTLGEYVELVDKAEEILTLQKEKYTIAAVTNGTKTAQDRKLRLSGLDKVFDAIFISETVGAEKPNMEFFDYVFKKLEIKDKSEVLIIGDSLTSDMQGGITAGIDTCWFNPSHEKNDLGLIITYEIDDLEMLKEIIK